MKKRIITLLAILTLLVACTVIAVQAKVELPADWTCPCCGKAYDEITWKTGNYTFNGGHYLVKTSYNGNLGGDVKISGTNVMLFGKDDGSALVYGAAKGKRLFAIQANAKVYMIGDGNVTLFSAGYAEGSETHGGVLHVPGSASLYLENLTVKLRLGSKASGQLTTVGSGKSGGLVMNAGSLTLVNVNMVDGDATAYGGAIYNEGTLSVTGGAFTNCSSAQAGGAIYNNGANATTTVTGTTFTNCASSTQGGAIANTAGDVVVDGATMTGCTAANSGTAYSNMSGDTVIKGATSITSAGTENDRVRISGGTLTLDGTASILGSNGEKTANILVLEGGKLQVAQTWDGTSSVEYVDKTTSGGNTTYKTVVQTPGVATSTYGTQVILKDGAYVDCTPANAGSEAQANKPFPGDLYAECAEVENPKINGWQHYLQPYRCQVVRASGTTWVIDYSNAVNDVSDETNAYVKAWANNASRNFTVAAGKNVYFDLNGRDYKGKATVNGNLYLFDSKAAVGAAGKTINATNVEPVTEINGKTYVNQIETVDSKQIATTYPIDFKITNVSLRPSAYAASLYYTASVQANAGAGLQNWGVAVTINENAGDTLADYMYTQTNETAEGNAYNGVLVKNIAKNGSEKNAEYAAKTIYAKAYVTLADGTVVFSNAASRNLTEIITAVEALDQTGMTDAQKTAIADMQASAWYADIFGAPEA